MRSSRVSILFVSSFTSSGSSVDLAISQSISISSRSFSLFCHSSISSFSRDLCLNMDWAFSWSSHRVCFAISLSSLLIFSWIEGRSKITSEGAYPLCEVFYLLFYLFKHISPFFDVFNGGYSHLSSLPPLHRI